MEKLKLMRLKHQISYQQMANLLDISKPFYWQIENDQRRLSYDMAVKIAHIFQTTPDELFLDETLEKLRLKKPSEYH
jgi:putative transcriptional regulator